MMDLQAGDSFEHFFQVSDKHYRALTDVFEDKNPLHTDPEFAQEKGFKDKVMHGAILMGFLSYFIGEQLPFKNVIVQSYKLQYMLPVYLNDKLMLRATIKNYFESVTTFEIAVVFINQDGKKIAKGEVYVGTI